MAVTVSLSGKSDILSQLEDWPDYVVILKFSVDSGPFFVLPQKDTYNPTTF